MNNEKQTDDGGAAFPHNELNYDGTCHQSINGMTMRDYFAAAALTGLLANNETSYGAKIIAPDCYEYADAMLQARKEQG